jgi:hypothetical protein
LKQIIYKEVKILLFDKILSSKNLLCKIGRLEIFHYFLDYEDESLDYEDIPLISLDYEDESLDYEDESLDIPLFFLDYEDVKFSISGKVV